MFKRLPLIGLGAVILFAAFKVGGYEALLAASMLLFLFVGGSTL